MKLYNPKGTSSPQPQQVKQRSYSSFPAFNWLEGMIIGWILAPLSLLLGVVTLAVLVLVAFGRVDYWGATGKVLVGIGVLLIIVLCVVSKPIGNLIFTIWSFMLFLIVVGLPMLAILYMCFKPVFEYLGFNF